MMCNSDFRLLWVLESPFPLLLHYEQKSPLVGDRYINSKVLTQPPLKPISLAELSGSFVVLSCLSVLSTAVLIVELSWNFRENFSKLPQKIYHAFKTDMESGVAVSASVRQDSDERTTLRLEK